MALTGEEKLDIGHTHLADWWCEAVPNARLASRHSAKHRVVRKESFSHSRGWNNKHYDFLTAAGHSQSVERLTAERKVVGSTPQDRTNTQGLKITEKWRNKNTLKWVRSKSGAVVRTLASHRRQGPGSNPGVDTIRGVAKFSTSCREMEGELATTSPEFKFHFQFPCGSPSTELSDFHQSARSGNERKCKQKLKNTCQG